MRLLSYLSESGPRVAAVRGEDWVDLKQADAAIPVAMRDLLAMGADGIRLAAEACEKGEPMARDAIRLLPPVPDPRKIICIGLNYADHARETGAAIPEEPVVFNKFPTTLRAHGQEIVLPAVSDKVDYEAELVAVIGEGGRDIPREAALAHVAGYTCGHDVSARDWQKGKPGGQWLLGKTFDTFAPLGPELVTADEIDDPGNLTIQLRLNGEVMQDSNTKHFIFPVDYLVSYLSRVCTLEPGDLIFTGTPPGVGVARNPPRFLSAGDIVEIEIERVGLLRNPVVDA